MSEEGEGPWALVTGGAGGIGHVLVRGLLHRGWKVRVLDNFSSGTRGNLQDLVGDRRVEILEGDVLDASLLRRGVEGTQFVWHLSANPDVRRGKEITQLDLEQGTVATQRVLEAMRHGSVRNIAFSSSSVVYGLPTVFPTPEDYGPLLPESLYGASKLASEGLVSAFVHTFGFRAWVFRFANVCGPGATHGVIYDFLEKLRRDPLRLEVLGDGAQRKGYLHVEDCVEAMIYVTEHAKEPVNVFNLAPEDTISVAEIAQRVVAAAAPDARIDYTGGTKGWAGDVPRQHLSIERLRRLGFTPRYRSAEVVEETIRALRDPEARPPPVPHG